MLDENFYVKFAQFEERQRETERWGREELRCMQPADTFINREPVARRGALAVLRGGGGSLCGCCRSVLFVVPQHNLVCLAANRLGMAVRNLM